MATDISACSVARVKGAGQGGGRARSCSYTAKVESSSAKVSGELAGTLAPFFLFLSRPAGGFSHTSLKI